LFARSVPAQHTYSKKLWYEKLSKEDRSSISCRNGTSTFYSFACFSIVYDWNLALHTCVQKHVDLAWCGSSQFITNCNIGCIYGKILKPHPCETKFPSVLCKYDCENTIAKIQQISHPSSTLSLLYLADNSCFGLIPFIAYSRSEMSHGFIPSKRIDVSCSSQYIFWWSKIVRHVVLQRPIMPMDDNSSSGPHFRVGFFF
jgi:hypothetical protein